MAFVSLGGRRLLGSHQGSSQGQRPQNLRLHLSQVRTASPKSSIPMLTAKVATALIGKHANEV